MCGGNEGAGAQNGMGFMDYTSIGAVVNALNALGEATVRNGGPNEAPGASTGHGYGGNVSVSGRVDGPGVTGGGDNLSPEAVAAWQRSTVDGTGKVGEDAYAYARRRDQEENEARQRAEEERRRQDEENRRRAEDDQNARRNVRDPLLREAEENSARPTDTPRPVYSPAAASDKPRSAADPTDMAPTMLDVARASLLGAPTDHSEAPNNAWQGAVPVASPTSAAPRPVVTPSAAPAATAAPPAAQPVAAAVTKVARPGPMAAKPKPVAGLYSGLSDGNNVRVVR